jgi:excinuclease ABC subunit C
MMYPETIREKLRLLPTAPGVYLMKGEGGEILYVGKAKSLRPRVRSYFAARGDDSLKTRELVRRIRDFDTIVVNSEAEALILENNLIKEYGPRFNINLRDDKTYPYVKVTLTEPFPRVLVTRKLQRDGSRYFGPFTDVRRMRHLLEVVKRLYTVRSCHYNLLQEAPVRACLDHHIGRCRAPCIGMQSREEYGDMIDEVVDVLAGRSRRAAERIRQEMAEASRTMNFERAAELRDALAHLDRLERQQQVVDVSGADRDVVGIARDGDEACGVVLKVRDGKLLGREPIFLDNLVGELDDTVLSTFVTRFYALEAAGSGEDLPTEILLPADFADRSLLESVLTERLGRAVTLHVPRRGEKLRVVGLADQNARHLLEERKLLATTTADRAPDALYELQEALELARVPRFIICFDISHTQGSETVASAVAFANGEPHKAEYRRLRIKGDWGNDDFRSMHEAVTRYFRRRLEGGLSIPDLVVIDGGKGQLSAARAAMEQLELAQQPVISLAKREEEVFVHGRPDPVRLPRRSPALRLLQRMRDEAHRFAVTYNRSLRTRRTVRSDLSNIPGVGAARQKVLLERFGSLRGLRSASETEISALPGFGPALARTVLHHVRGVTENRPAEVPGANQNGAR